MTWVRIIVLCEGDTEALFISMLLAPHLASFERSIVPIDLKGIKSYGYVRRQLQHLADSDPGAWLTTMFDLYALPDSFPALGEHPHNPLQRASSIEQAIAHDLQEPHRQRRIRPYLSVHELEALLFSEPQAFAAIAEPEAINRLVAMTTGTSPEYINDGRETSPSKRISAVLTRFKKNADGIRVAQTIGLPRMRAQCAHFDAWVTWLETVQ